MSSSNPDRDTLRHRWFFYPEPSTYRGSITLRNPADAELAIPAGAGGKTIHVVLQVTDDGIPPLTWYRRIVVSAKRHSAD